MTMSDRDYRKVLHIDPEADPDVVQAAYEVLEPLPSR
jgi:hypothetical protein